MKPTKLYSAVLAFLCTTFWCSGQGTVNFNTAVSFASTIQYAAGTPVGGPTGTKIDGAAHPTAQAAIYAGAAGSTEAQLVMITPAAGFASGATAGYITAGSR